MNPTILLRLALATLPVQMAISWRLWWPHPSRHYPALPAFEVLGVVPAWVSAVLVVLTVGLCISLIFNFLNKKYRPELLLAGGLLALCLLDLHRLQVWVWMWLLLLVAFDFSKQKNDDTTSLPRLVLPAVYVWSGLHKLTPWFAEDNFGFLCRAFGWSSRWADQPTLGYGMAVGETLIGLGLLWSPTRRIAVAAALGMHSVILAILSPLGHDWNHVVIPWNVAMMALVVYFFSGKNIPALRVPRSAVAWAVLALAWVAPLLNAWGLWPESMSWKMYANTQPEASLRSPNGVPCPEFSGIWQRKSLENQYFVLDDWAYEELNVPAFSSLRGFESAARRMCACEGQPDSTIRLNVLRTEGWRRKGEESIQEFKFE
jgi:hypothetical protein